MQRKEDKKLNYKKAGLSLGTIFAVFVAIMFIIFQLPKPVFNNDEGVWQTIWEGNIASAAENNPGAGASGWLATFCLDYAETPTTCLASNATNGAYDGWGNVSGYVNTDNTDTDLKSEDPFYFVVRCRFNQTHCHNGTAFIASRCKCFLTVSGDETISDVSQLGDDDGTDNNGGGQVSYNNSGGEFIYINFWWDDNNDGYRITDDGSLAWNITIQAKF